MKRVRLVLGVVAVAASLLLAGCSTTIRTTSDMFQTGRSLATGKSEVGVRGTAYPFMPFTAYFDHGFGDGFQLDVGYGLHGIILSSNKGTPIQGPEVYLTKDLFNLSDVLYFSGTVGSELNFLPSFDAVVHAGVNIGLYPVKWLTLYTNVRGMYIVGGIPGMILSAGIGIDGPFTLKIAGFYSPIPVLKTTSGGSTASGDVLWPYGASIDFGVKF